LGQEEKVPVRLEDIEEFAPARRIPRTAITDEIRAGIRKLDEDKEIERYLRDILPDHTKTPHTSTEIADILTTHVSYAGRPRLAAFINKGKAFPKVTAREVTHQIVRVQQLPHLSLIVLLAVGDIQDDAKRDLLYTATNTRSDYIIVDVDDIARLFIATHKVCPKDGTPYEGGRCRKCGTPASEPIKVTLDVFEEPRYDILSHEDISVGTAKRYKATILTDPHYTKETIKEVIKTATLELRQSTFYGNSMARNRFGQQEAGCVFLFVYVDRRDIQPCNWICRTSWIHPDVPEIFRPPYEWRRVAGGNPNRLARRLPRNADILVEPICQEGGVDPTSRTSVTISREDGTGGAETSRAIQTKRNRKRSAPPSSYKDGNKSKETLSKGG
jgi:hypothetical protein